MIEATPMFGILLVALVAMLVLGLLALLVFLVIARHRLLGFIVLGFVLLFVVSPVLLYITASRQAAYQSRRAVEHELLLAQEARVRALSDVERERARMLEMQVLEGAHPRVHPVGPNPPSPPSPPVLVEATAALEEASATDAVATFPATDEPHPVAEVATPTELSFWQAEDSRDPAGADAVSAAQTPWVATSDTPGPRLAEPSEEPATGTEDADPVVPGKSTWSTAASEVGPAAVVQPEWVRNPPATFENQPAEVVVSDLFETMDECEQDLEHRIQAAIESFAERHSRQMGVRLRLPLPIQDKDIQQVSRERFVDVMPTSVGPMKHIHQLVVFDAKFRRVLDRRVSEAVIGQRLSQTGVFSGGVLLLVGSLFGILKGASRWRSKVASA